MSATPFDRQAVLANFGGDAGLLAQVAAILVEQWPLNSARLRAARDALDLKALRAEAHLLKGSFGNLAAGAAVAAARELESAAAAAEGDASRLDNPLGKLLDAGDELIAALRAETRA